MVLSKTTQKRYKVAKFSFEFLKIEKSVTKKRTRNTEKQMLIKKKVLKCKKCSQIEISLTTKIVKISNIK